MLNQTEIAIGQISEYIQRVCQGMQLQEAKERLQKKLVLYSADGCNAEILNTTFASALKSHTRDSFFSHIKQSEGKTFKCPHCGTEGEHTRGIRGGGGTRSIAVTAAATSQNASPRQRCRRMPAMNKIIVNSYEIILRVSDNKRNSYMRLFFLWLLICSPFLLLGSILGLAAAAIWLANTVILTLITRYVVTRRRGNYDGWDGYDG